MVQLVGLPQLLHNATIDNPSATGSETRPIAYGMGRFVLDVLRVSECLKWSALFGVLAATRGSCHLLLPQVA